MQIKHILPVLLTICAPSVFAQQAKVQAKSVAPATQSVVAAKATATPGAKNDSTATKSTLKSSTPLIAGNMAAGKDAKPDPKKGYDHVPLAGEKSYFGEKNEYVNDFVRKYLELHNRTLGSVQNNSTTPFSVIDDVLEKKKLPKELKYLAVIESALNHNAVSHAGAVGTWQLMETTARMMGLTVNRKGDERRDLYKSTTAATKYLELLYGQLNDWLLVIAAYNSGPTPVQKAIELTGSHNFWDIKEYLPKETQGHVLAFIATASIFENMSKFIELGSVPADFKFGKEEEPAPLAPVSSVTGTKELAASAPKPAQPVKRPSFTDEEVKNMTMVRITDPLNLEITAFELGIEKKLLTRWNSDYDLFVIKAYPTPFYNLRIPKDKLDIFLSKKDMLTKKSKSIASQNK